MYVVTTPIASLDDGRYPYAAPEPANDLLLVIQSTWRIAPRPYPRLDVSLAHAEQPAYGCPTLFGAVVCVWCDAG